MPSLRLLLLLPALAAAHFNLNAPVPVGPFDEDTEPTAPCGGLTVDFSKDTVTEFHVGGEPIAVKLGHVTANWLFRATLDDTAASNWTQLFPILTQTGLGDYCQPAVSAPESWVGQQGVVGVVADAADGLLYQCATVKFVSGSGTQTSTCTNGSSVSAAFASDASLSALVDSDSSSTTGTSTSSSSSTSSSASSMAHGLAPSLGGMAASLAAVTVAGLLGAGLVL
ncbi:hypothetical protein VMCG_06635 [Cytospora schulzeri]|uniref:Copper acquisition factor BIM1-like domain-containing protein n=1 Tax=Cytospora schulzeri TaxID=448051 RepID=A0A423W6U6_9PEZI|nr:hypothetical protein VMCG_06635 [Valsa malicola]